jgi:hypothetical protein
VNPGEAKLLVDGHVHLHERFDRESFLDSALRNFRSGALALGLPPGTAGCLLFTETARDHQFRRLAAEAGASGKGRWRFEATGEERSLLARREDGEWLVLVAGSQVQTAERLEVLALATLERVPDGSPLREVLERLLGGEGVAALPWGFGKWWLRRGSLLRRIVDEHERGPLFLADNGGRPRLHPRPALFRRGEARGLRLLAGSDPLPLPRQELRVASYGFEMEAPAAWDTPARHLVERLRSLERSPRLFGRLEGLGPFLRSQARVHWRRLDQAVRA